MTVKKKNKESAMIDFSQDSLAGFENVDQDDLGIPFLIILQKLSPELDEGSPKYRDGLEAGMIINSITGEAYGGKGEPVSFVPCIYKKMFVEWTPREQGGGFVRTHPDPSILEKCKRNDRGQDIYENGNIIVTTAYVFGFALHNDDAIRCVIGFTSTQLKKSRQWLSLMMNIKLEGPDGDKFTPPMYSHKYHLSTVPESNEKGNWFGWKIENAGIIDDAKLIGEAREAYKQISSGKTGLNLLAARTQDEELHDRF